MSLSLTPITIVPRKPENKNDRLIQLSIQLLTRLHINEHSDLLMMLGRKNIKVEIQTGEIAPNEIILPENIFKDFCLPIQRLKFQAIYLPEVLTLRLGPVVGLLTDFPSNMQDVTHFRKINRFCVELHQLITENGGFFYVFSYDQFLNRGYYLENEKWIAAELPLPDVIYNRIHSRLLERNIQYKQFRSKLELLSIPFFNDRFLSKWEISKLVNQENHLLPFLPETKIFSKEHLNELAQKYERVFIKPVHGSQGRNIIKLKKAEDTHYTFQTSLAALNSNFEKKFTLDEFYQLIKPFLQNQSYIIQQGIPLLTYNTSTLDFRVLCHKNPINQWQVTSLVARVAAKRGFVSNLARGGRLVMPLHALRTSMNKKQSSAVLGNMKELALEIASVISSSTAGITGELGIDIGVDIDGYLWLIEVNSKPSKSFEDGLGKIRPSAKAIIQFSTMLAFDSEIINGG
ncbi:MAG: YheC/YheD family protein [Bacillus sp. (in: Bacteria)]|nr:YheC/YheD family protein [Bacillus sp. (in: firmicutes)]